MCGCSDAGVGGWLPGSPHSCTMFGWAGSWDCRKDARICEERNMWEHVGTRRNGTRLGVVESLHLLD